MFVLTKRTDSLSFPRINVRMYVCMYEITTDNFFFLSLLFCRSSSVHADSYISSTQSGGSDTDANMEMMTAYI